MATFKEEDCKAVVLNVTRCESITEIAKTRDYEKWPGTRVHISQGTTRYGGKKVPCIVIGPTDLAF